MNEATANALDELNRRFYDRWAEDFHRTREAPWPGWRRLLRTLPAASDTRAGTPTRVLDVGCGNGRLALFLAAGRGASTFTYLGVDSSLPLLARARRRLPAQDHLIAANATGEGALALFHPATFSIVAAFGLLHHVPGFARRRALLAAMAQALAPGGLLWLSLWQFGREQRFARRCVHWEEYNRSTEHPIDTWHLEPGDVLLRWGDERHGAVRYCHFTDRVEAESLVRDLDLDLTDRYEDDGREGNLNLYLALRRHE